MADSYRESYQSYEVIRYDTVTVVDEYAGWSSKRRCGYRFESGYFSTTFIGWMYSIAESSGNHNTVWYLSSEQRCNCSQKYGPFNVLTYYGAYAAICLSAAADIGSDEGWSSWASSKTCPKGWGKGIRFKSNGSNYVSGAQGYLTSNITHTEKEPIYGYVTRYRTKYYNYIGSRVAKI